jgi:hypothetical protein
MEPLRDRNTGSTHVVSFEAPKVTREIEQHGTGRLRVATERSSADDAKAGLFSVPSDRPEQPGLADAGFARHQQQLTTTRGGFANSPDRKRDQLVSADEDRRGGYWASRHRATSERQR